MLFILRLKTLFDSLKALVANFPASKADVSALIADVEAAVLTKSWTLDAAYKVIGDAEKLLSDFMTEWDGSAAQWAAFATAFAALFA